MARHLWITGLVQGVGYRAGFAARARQLGLSGWVRNRTDGSVEALVAGGAQAVDQMIDWARHGPASARVDEIRIGEEKDPAYPSSSSASFSILPTE